MTGCDTKSIKSLRELNGRYSILELLRLFAYEDLSQRRDSHDEVCTHHAYYYSCFLKSKEKELLGLKEREALNEISLEIDNIRSAWNFAVLHNLKDVITNSVNSLYSFYDLTGWIQEGVEVFRRAEERLRRKEDLVTFALVLEKEGMFSYRQARYEEVEVIFKSKNLKMDLARTVIGLGNTAYRKGNISDARANYQNALNLSKKIDYHLGMALALNGLGVINRVQGKFARAKGNLKNCIDISRKIGYQRGIALAFNNLGNIAIAEKQFVEARNLYQECLIIFEEIGDVGGKALSTNNLGYVLYKLGEYDEAQRLLEKGLEIYTEIGEKRGMALTLINLGNIAIEKKEEKAKSLLIGALRLATEINVRGLSLEAAVSLADYYQWKKDYNRAWQIVNSITIDEIIDDDLEDRVLDLTDKIRGKVSKEKKKLKYEDLAEIIKDEDPDDNHRD